MAFFLTQKAKADLKDIARYTQKTWGIAQRNIYLTQIDSTFHNLAINPKMGFSCDYIRAGYFKFRVGKHFIFYRIADSDIEIVRILHERMDIETRLEED